MADLAGFEEKARKWVERAMEAAHRGDNSKAMLNMGMAMNALFKIAYEVRGRKLDEKDIDPDDLEDILKE